MRGGGLVGLGVLALAGCSDRDEAPQPKVSAAITGAKLDAVPCAVGDEKPKDCLREIGVGPDGPTWTVRRGDGGFRRFVLIDNGRRIASADGADEVRAKRQADFLEVFVAKEYYRFPDDHAAKP